MKFYALFISFLFVANTITTKSACTTIPSSSNLNWVNGKWEGIGHQIDGTTWKIELEFIDKNNIKIKYPSLACGGDWSFVSIENNEIKLLEHIDFGINNCDQGVDVKLRKVSKKELEVNYFLNLNDAPTMIAYADLKKVN